MFRLSDHFGPVGDRNYRIILRVGGFYSILIALIPIIRLVPRPPLQLGIWLIALALYKHRRLPDVFKMWIFYAFLFVTYPALRNVVSTYPDSFHGIFIIGLEEQIFGVLPTVWLQSLMHPSPGLRWFDYLFAAFHCTIFVFPLAFPIVLLWRRGAAVMKRASVALVILTLAGYLTYVLYPLTPPWMAEIEGIAPDMERVVFRAIGKMIPGNVVGAFQPSPRGAMPSLHAGVPLLTLLIAFREFGRKAAWLAAPVALISFEIIYGAEHYVLDVVAGIVYAVAAYFIVYRWLLPVPVSGDEEDAGPSMNGRG